MGQDRGGGKRVLQKLEGLLAIITPKELVILSSEGDYRCHYVAVILDEPSVEIRES